MQRLEVGERLLQKNNMSKSLHLFIDAVTESRLLSREQKELLLERPSEFSEAYRTKLTDMLLASNRRSLARERELRLKLEEEYQTLMRKLYADGIDPSARDAILEKARAQINSCFPST